MVPFLLADNLGDLERNPGLKAAINPCQIQSYIARDSLDRYVV